MDFEGDHSPSLKYKPLGCPEQGKDEEQGEEREEEEEEEGEEEKEKEKKRRRKRSVCPKEQGGCKAHL